MRRILPILSLALLVLVPSAHAVIAATPSRLDLGELVPGGEGSWTVEVANKDARAVSVTARLELPEGEPLVVSPAEFTLPPHGSQVVRVSLALPAALSGGRHDPRVAFVETGEGGAETVAVGGVTVPVVFWVEGPKLGALSAVHASEGEPAAVRLLLQNFLRAPSPAELRVRVLDAAGEPVLTSTHLSEVVETNASLSVEVPLATQSLPHGAYTVEAQAAQEGRLSNALTTTLLVGERRLEIAGVAPTTSGEDVAFALTVRNAGSVPLGGQARVDIAGADGSPREIVVPVEAITPGGLSEVTLRASLRPGTYAWTAGLDWVGGSFELPGGALSILAEDLGAQQAAASSDVPALPLVGALALGLGALAFRRKD